MLVQKRRRNYLCVCLRSVCVCTCTLSANGVRLTFMFWLTQQVHVCLCLCVIGWDHFKREWEAVFAHAACVCVCVCAAVMKKKPSLCTHGTNITVVISLGSAVVCSLNGQPWNELQPQSLKLILSQPLTTIRFHLELFLTHTHFFWELIRVTQQAQVHVIYSQSRGFESESEGFDSSSNRKQNRNSLQKRICN